MPQRALCSALACGSLILATFIPSVGHADEVDDTFESLFAKQIKQVQATTDFKDDIALADEMTAAAKPLTSHPKLATKLCLAAYDLTHRREPGFESAAAAMNVLLDVAPDQKIAATERLADVRQKQHTAAKPARKAAAALELLQALDHAAAVKEAAGDSAGALVHLRQAMLVVRAAAPDRVELFQLRHDRAALLARSRDRAARLEAEIKAAGAPGIVAAKIDELVKLYVIDLDTPAAAAPHLPSLKDEALRANTAEAIKPPADLPAAACRSLGLWYRSLAQSAAPAVRAPLLVRSHIYLDRFLTLHETKDLVRAQAELTIPELAKAMHALGPLALKLPSEKVAVITPSTPSTPGRNPLTPAAADEKLPDNLLKLVDLDEDTVQGIWKTTESGGVISPSLSSGATRLHIPINLEGDYKFTVKFKRTAGEEAVVVVLPLPNSRMVGIVLNGWVRPAGGLSFIEANGAGANGPDAVKGLPIVNDRLYTLAATVKIDGQKAAINVELDGKPFMNWSGHRMGTWVQGNWLGYVKDQVTLGSWSSEVLFESASVEMLTGKARRAPRLICEKMPEGAVYLSDLKDKETIVDSFHWNNGVEFGRKGDFRGTVRAIKIAGVRSVNGIYMHPIGPGRPAHVTYDIGGKYKTFVAAAGINDQGEMAASDVTFTVRGDGKDLWQSKPTKGGGKVEPVQIDVTGVQKLELLVASAGNVACARGVWIEPALYEKALEAPLVKADPVVVAPAPVKGKQGAPATPENEQPKPSGRGFFGIPTN